MALAVALLVTAAEPVRGVLIQTVSGTDNTTAPADDPGFASVGYSTNGLGTAIYLGEGWVLTAGHVGGGGIVLASGTYLEKAGTGFTLVNGTTGKTTDADLYMYELATAPVGLPTLAIAATSPGIGTPVTMIGGGFDRGSPTQWLVNTSTTPWVWTVTGSGGNYAGYGTLSTRSIRWGTNIISGSAEWQNDGLDTFMVSTRFDEAPGTFEAQAVLRDSGGAVFTKTGGQWSLAGVILAISLFSNQPGGIGTTAVFGNETFIADLAYYRPQIVSAVPEPAAATLAGLAAATGGLWRLTRRRRR